MNNTILEELNLKEAILQHLLLQIEILDNKRWFAGLRKPSKTQRDILDKISNVHKRRAEIYNVS